MSEDFEQVRYRLMQHAIAPEAARAATERALALARDPQAFVAEPRYGARGRYADELTERLLLELQPLVEKVVGRSLHPCYSYLRLYGTGADLHAHLDRPSCEYSTTLTLGYDADAPWPIWVRRDGVGHAVSLGVGDMLVYMGAQVVHWRERFAGRWWLQAFLHYVDAQGDYARFKFDGRERIGAFDWRTGKRANLPPPEPRPSDPCPCLSDRPYGECHGRRRLG